MKGGVLVFFISPAATKTTMRGCKYNESDRNKVTHLLAAGMTSKQINAQTGIPIRTIDDWKKSCEKTKDFAELREDYKKRFEETTSDCINKGINLIQKNFDRAIDAHEALDELLKDYMAACEEDGEELSNEQIKALAKKISALKCEDTAKIANTVGILYDKRALSQGKETSRVSVTFEDFPE